MQKLKVQDLSVKAKRVLVRVDFNVPQDDAGNITDDTRIRSALPTIQLLINQGASMILMSHLGRPKGQHDSKYSLAPCAKRLSELLKKPVHLAPDCIGKEVEQMASALKPGEVLLLENLRFHAAEEKPEQDPEFAKKLASFGDFYVNDAFGAAHRAHSSVTEITKYFPGKSAAGLLMQKEIEFLGNALLKPQKPFYAIIGGAKISSKLGVIHSLLNKVDALFIGGGMSYTFMKAQGLAIGDSIHEDDLIPKAKDILNIAATKGIPLYLPKDIVVADSYSPDASSHVAEVKKGIPDHFQGLDMGPETVKSWQELLKQAKTIFWNGPLGVAEFPAFAKGTDAIAKCLSGLEAMTIVGGGDSVAALQKMGLADKISHVSTGGGAALEYIEFGKLPGVEALTSE